MEEVIRACVAMTIVYMSVWYLYGLKIKDMSIADVAWGLGFYMLALFLLIASPERTVIQIVMTAQVTVWGLRLAYHIDRRKRGKPEDWRYAAWRKQWGRWHAARSYFQIFMLQGLLLLIIAAPLFVAAYPSDNPPAFGFVQYIGLLIWGAGFCIEVAADRQLKTFLLGRHKKDAIMTSGIWAYSRHPNYFGEMAQWWGLWVMVIGLPYFWFGISGPLLITFLLLFVSGVPLLERKYKHNKAYQQYAKQTSMLLPLPKRKVES